MTDERIVLVLGATGGIGGEIARQMRDAGWQVRALKRGGSVLAEQKDGITWLNGDAMDRASVSAAAQGATVIVHAVNPPGYRNWPKVVLPMLDNTIAAAGHARATIVLPGTIYNFGPDACKILSEASPQNPTTCKGKIRVAMERRLRDYAARGGRVLIVRAGDFFGPRTANSWFSQGLVRPERPITRVYDPGKRGMGHTWSYVPDVARTILELLDKRATLEPFAAFHMAGHWDADGTQMIEAIRRIVARYGHAKPKIAGFPWWLLTVLAPFVTTFREMGEMRYLWRVPLRMDNTRLRAMLGREPHTPLDQAVEATLRGLGCLKVSGATTSLQR